MLCQLALVIFMVSSDAFRLFCSRPSEVEMDCSNRNLGFIPTPPNPRKIEILKFDGNSLESITKSTLKTFTNLREASFDGNNIHQIEAGALTGLTQLEFFSLRSNVLESLPEDLLGGTSNLRSIDLSWNILRNIDFNLENQSSLVEIHLSNNQISSIKGNAFAGAHNINKISLDGNKITKINPQAFSQLFYLTHLVLFDNLLEEVELTFLSLGQRFHQLYLDIHNCQLRSFPRLKSQTLGILNLSDNQIKSVEQNEVRNIGGSLLSLDLSRNRIEFVDEGTFSIFPQLVSVDLRDNFMRNVPENLPNSIKELNLQNNLIEEIIPNRFVGLSQLSKLDVSGNNLKEIFSFSFEGLTRLESLNLSNNSIQKMDLRFLTSFSVLRTLIMTNNRALNVTVYSTFDKERLAEISEIDLTKSDGLCSSLLDFIPNMMGDDVDRLHMEECGVSGNGMENIVEISVIREIKICGNPWVCSESQWMTSFVEKYPKIYKDNVDCFNCQTNSGNYISFKEYTKPTTTTTKKEVPINTSIPPEIDHPKSASQEAQQYKIRDIIVIIAVVAALVLFFVIVIVSFNHVLKVREGQKKMRSRISKNNYIRADSMVFSPLKDEIFYGTSKDPLVKTMERQSGKSPVDMEQFNAWIGSF